MNRIKLCGFLTIVCFVFMILPNTASADETELQITQGQTNQTNKIEFGLRIMGGGFLLMQNDINDHIQGMNDSINDFAGLIPDVSVDSEFKQVNMGMDFSGELLIHFMPQFSIGIGAGYISAGKESTAELSDNTGEYQDMTLDPRVSAIPITLSFYYGIPVGSMIDVVLNAGAGYYLGTINYDMILEYGDPGSSFEEIDTWSAQSNTLGFLGGIDFEFGFSSNMVFVLGARGRYVKFTDLTGDLEWEYSSSWGASGSGTDKDQTLWFGNQEMFTGKEYPQLTLSDSKPTGSNWSDVRKAEISLSGIIFQAGIKVTF
ncbi:MAG: hypothetical protein R6V00_02450 [Candidatus Aminicenantes bacterium]